jgi:hypothetical protein
MGVLDPAVEVSQDDRFSALDCPPLITAPARLLDVELMHQVLSGLLNPPPRVTVKSLVKQHLPAIRAARRKGWSIAQIAAALAEAGVLINEATLRKYLSQLDKPETSSRRRPAAPKKRPNLPEIAATTPDADAPRRSLRRSAYLNTQTLTKEN